MESWCKVGKIKYWYYDNYSDYPKTYNSKKSDSIFISRWELEKYSLLNALFNGHVLSKTGKEFYSSFHKMAIKEDDKDNYICTPDYKCAETSYKVTISFALGMIVTRIIALKKYDIVHLFHLKDKSITYFSKSGKIPDWFGVDSHGVPFLFESKGTDGPSVGKVIMKGAKDQLTSIRSIIDKSGSIKTFTASDFKRHVIVSCFRDDRKSKIKDRWYAQDVDPEGEGTIDVVVDLDKEYFKYYEKYVAFMDSYNTPYVEMEINQQIYYFLSYENEKLGIHKSIYNAVKSGKYTENNEFRNFYKNIGDVLNAIKCEKYIEDSSSFEDGIIVCSREKFS